MSFKLTVGRMAIAGCELFTNEAIVAIEPRSSVSGQYLRHFLANADFASVTDQAVKGVTLNKSKLAGLPVVLPPPVEQQAIAATLDAIDETIERTESVIAATEALRHALLNELLTRGLPGRHVESRSVPGLGTSPVSWQVSTLGELGRWTTGGTPSKQRPEYWLGQIPWISPKDMKTPELWDAADHISAEGVAAGSTLAEPGAILVVVRGMILAHSFPIALLRARCAFNQDIRALTCVRGALPEFVVLALEAQRRALIDLASPTTHGTMRVVMDSMLARPIALPPLDEQAAIVEHIVAVARKTTADRLVLSALHAGSSAVSDALLSGRIRTQSCAEITAL